MPSSAPTRDRSMPASADASSGPGGSSANPAGSPCGFTSMPIILELAYDKSRVVVRRPV
jgi:hypothetical protein